MRKKNGFTLIELLVVIALMISILVIAIVNFTSVSEGKRNESWSYVKSQIETAAEEYLTANEYLFEGLDADTVGNITVGKLVKEGYLNKVTDPRDGKAVDTCSYVKVTKENNIYRTSYEEKALDEKTCDVNDSTIVISELGGAPSATISYYKNSDCSGETLKTSSSGWFNIDTVGQEGPNKTIYVKIEPTEDSTDFRDILVNSNNDNIKEITNENNKKAYCAPLTEDGDVNYNVVVTGDNGKKTSLTNNYKKDTVRPTYSASVAYKVYNLDNRNCSNNIESGTYKKNGIYCDSENNNKDVYIKWDNTVITSGENYKIKNIDSFYVSFKELENVSRQNIGFYINNSSKEIRNENSSDPCSKDGGTFTCDLSSYSNVNQIKVVFKGKSLGWVNELDSAGLNIITNNQNISNNGSITIYNNYSNITRIGSIVKDDISGFNYYEIQSKTKNLKSEKITDQERRDFSNVNPTNALQDGNYYGQDSYLINSYDKAGNVTKINLNTSGKF